MWQLLCAVLRLDHTWIILGSCLDLHDFPRGVSCRVGEVSCWYDISIVGDDSVRGPECGKGAVEVVLVVFALLGGDSHGA